MMRVPRITLSLVWLLLPPILTLVYVGTLVQYPLDFWHHLVNGRQIAQSGVTSGYDIFTFTIVGQRTVNQNWLTQLIIYYLYRQGGFALVQFSFAACYALAIGLIGYTAWRRCADARVAAVLALATMALAASNFGVRPQAMSLVLFAAELFVLWHCAERWESVAAVTLIEILWANCHGAFLLGIALPGLFLLAAAVTVWRRQGMAAVWSNRPFRVYLACAVAALAAAFCSPHFRHTTDYFFVVASKGTQRQIGEWLPTELGTYTGTAFYVSLLLTIAVLASNMKRVTATETMLLLVFGILGCTAQRMVVWWGMMLPAVLAPHLAAIARRWSKTSALAEVPRTMYCRGHHVRMVGIHSRLCAGGPDWSAANCVVLGLLLGWAALCTPWTRTFNPLLPAEKRRMDPADEPRAAVALLRQTDFAGRVFQPMEWGSYLTWHLYPQATIFADGRIDCFPDSVWNDYVRIGNADEGWESLLDSYRVDCVVWDPKLSERLPAALRSSGRWAQVGSDSVCVVFRRQRREVPNHKSQIANKS